MTDLEPNGEAFDRLAGFLAGGRLTGVVSKLEHTLAHSDAAEAGEAVAAADIDGELLTAALLIRRDLGRLNDLIHASAISLALSPSSARRRRSDANDVSGTTAAPVDISAATGVSWSRCLPT